MGGTFLRLSQVDLDDFQGQKMVVESPSALMLGGVFRSKGKSHAPLPT